MKLKQYLEKNTLVHSRFAEKCGMQRSMFCRIVSGNRVPDPISAMKIKKVSGGIVTEFDKIINDHLELIRANS